jgi:hypothetical protein
MSSARSSAAVDNTNLQSQIAALRESLKNQRNRARKMWDACAPDAKENVEENRQALGRFTEKLLKGQIDEVYG